MKLGERLVALFQQKLSRDIAWTVGSFGVLAVSGLVINIVVVAFRDAEALGVFNQAYAVYMVASQLAVFGIHYSVLRHAALHENNPAERGHLLGTAAIAALVLGFGAAAATLLASPVLGRYFDSPLTGRAIAWSAGGLLLFPLNKVLVFYLNALRHMKAFAVLQATRYLTVMVVVSGFAASTASFEYATLGLFVAEALTTLCAAAYLLRRRLVGVLRFSRAWLGQHFAFGGKSMLSGMFAEMNSRVDVLLLGFFMTDFAVGVYSFAAMLVDGLYHVLAMVRVNFNPILVGAVRDGAWPMARSLLKAAVRYAPPATAVLSLCIITGYLLLALVIAPEKELMAGWPSLLILLAGVFVVSPFVPFENLMLVTGHPARQTAQHLLVVCSNATINLLLVPTLGIAGAAIGTAGSYVVGTLTLMFLAQRCFGWNLLTNRLSR